MPGFRLRRSKPPQDRATLWSRVQIPGMPAAYRRGPLDELFASYWLPVYRLQRRAHGVRHNEAAYLCEAVFLRALATDLDAAEASLGLRAWLRATALDDPPSQIKRRSAIERHAPPEWAQRMEAGRAEAWPAARGAALPLFDQEFGEALSSRALDAFLAECDDLGVFQWGELARLYFRDLPDDSSQGRVAVLAGELQLPVPEAARLLSKVRQAYRRHIVAEVRATLPVDELHDRGDLKRELMAVVGALG